MLGDGEEQGLGSKMEIQPRLQDENFVTRSKSSSYVQPYCAGHSYHAASNESPDDGSSIIFASPLSAINSHFPEGGR